MEDDATSKDLVNPGGDPMEDPDEELTVAAVAQQLGLNPATIRNWVNSERIVARRDGRRWMIRRGDVAELLRDNQSLGRAHRSRRSERLVLERADRIRREQAHDNGATFRPTESSILI